MKDRLEEIQARWETKGVAGYDHAQAMDDLEYLLARLQAAEAVCKAGTVMMEGLSYIAIGKELKSQVKVFQGTLTTWDAAR